MATETTEKRRVKPSQPGGVRDYLPGETIARLRMLATIEAVYRRFGFDPIETPALERREVLTGGKSDRFSMTIFRTALWTGRHGEVVNWEEGEEDNALRFDHTVPLARLVAANLGTMQFPWKRYARGPVWRGEKPQAGRFREFWQFDADIVGSASPYADAEIVSLMYETMRALGFERFMIRLNDRRILDALAPYAEFDLKYVPFVLRALDKLDSAGEAEVRRLLALRPMSEFDESVPGLKETQIERLLRFVAIKADGWLEMLERVEEVLGGISTALEGTAALTAIGNALPILGVPATHWQLDLAVARGLDYYTGPVFETHLTDAPKLGSVFSGGRYDGLIGSFSDATVPATGASIGVDRLFGAMKELGLVSGEPQTTIAALVTVMDAAGMSEYLRLVTELRVAGINASLYLGENMAFRAQIAYAAATGVPIVLILGERERIAGAVRVKHMPSRAEGNVKRENLIETLRAILDGASPGLALRQE